MYSGVRVLPQAFSSYNINPNIRCTYHVRVQKSKYQYNIKIRVITTKKTHVNKIDNNNTNLTVNSMPCTLRKERITAELADGGRPQRIIGVSVIVWSTSSALVLWPKILPMSFT